MKNFLTRYKKELFILSLLLIIGIVFKLYIDKRAQMIELNSAIVNKDASIKYWIDKDNNNHAIIAQVETSKKELSLLFGKKIDSIANQLNLKSKQLTQYIGESTITNGNFNSKVDTIWSYKLVKGDTVKVPEYLSTTYQDKWLTFEGKIKDLNLSANYSIKDSLQIVGYWKRRNFFSPKEYYMDISSSNPSTTILNAKNFKVDNAKSKNLGVGILGGYGISNKGLSPFVGIGVFYKLF